MQLEYRFRYIQSKFLNLLANRDIIIIKKRRKKNLSNNPFKLWPFIMVSIISFDGFVWHTLNKNIMKWNKTNRSQKCVLYFFFQTEWRSHFRSRMRQKNIVRNVSSRLSMPGLAKLAGRSPMIAFCLQNFNPTGTLNWQPIWNCKRKNNVYLLYIHDCL